MRTALTALTVAACMLASGLARADRRSCEAAFAAAPLSVKDGHYVAARQSLMQCADDECPAAMRPLCLDDLQKLTARIPSVVFAAKGSDGRDRVDVRVSEGGVALEERLDGRALDLDPGAHTFRFETTGAPAVTIEVLVREGEQARAVVAIFAPPEPPQGALRAEPAPAAIQPSRPIPWTVYAAGGVALAASAAWAGFGIDGISERSSLSGCIGHCSASAVQTASSHLDIADGFMVGSLVAWAGTAALFFTRPRVVPVMAFSHEGATFGLGGRF